MIFGRTIATNDIADIKLYCKSTKTTKSSILNVLKANGYDVALTGPIFLRKPIYGTPCCHFKVDSNYKCNPQYATTIAQWNTAKDFEITFSSGVHKKNGFSCVELIRNKVAVTPINCGADMKYACHRVAIGTKNDRLAYYATTEKVSPEKLQSILTSAGWHNAIMLDGGGSAFCVFKDGTGFSGDGRVVPFMILIKLKSSTAQPTPSKPSSSTESNVAQQKGRPIVYAYNMSLDGNVRVSEHFRLSEFACNDRSPVVFVAPKLVEVLEQIRKHFNAPIRISSGYRTFAYNSKIKNASKRSQHCLGTAADITVVGVAPDRVASYARSLMKDFGGVGRYNSFTHVDVRSQKADWDYR